MRKTDAPLRQAKWLERAAELLVLRNDTLRIIDGAGPSVEADQASIAEPEQTSETQTDQVSSPNEAQKIPASVPTEQATGALSRKKACPKSPHQTHARFLGSFKFPSSVLRRVVLRLWSVPAVGEQGPFLQAVEGCASSRTTNAKRTLPLPGDGGKGVERETDWDVVGG
jgi:hypothetical protein